MTTQANVVLDISEIKLCCKIGTTAQENVILRYLYNRGTSNIPLFKIIVKIMGDGGIRITNLCTIKVIPR